MSFTVGSGGLSGNPAAGTYLNKRDIEVLKQVGAVSGDELSVLERSDQIGVANKNGVVEVSELNTMWGEANATLFPEEKLALGTVWEKFRIQDAAFTAVNIPPLEFKDIPGSLGAVDPNQPFLIADLPQQFQRIARRIQLNLNQDGDPPTIQYADVLKALEPEHVGHYTSGEITQVKELKERFLDEILPRAMKAPGLEVPELGEHRKKVLDCAGMKGYLVTENSLTLRQTQTEITRPSPTYGSREGISSNGNSLEYERRIVGLQLNIPAGHKAVVVSDVDREQVLNPPRAVLSGKPGNYLVELYDANGTKVGDQTIKLGDAAAKRNLTADHMRKELVDDKGVALAPQLASFEEKPMIRERYNSDFGAQGFDREAKWTFVPASDVHHAGDAAAAAAPFEPATSNLRDGRYQTTFTTTAQDLPRSIDVEIQKFEGNRYRAVLGGKELWLTPHNGYRGHTTPNLLFSATTNHGGVSELSVMLDPKTNALSLHGVAPDRRGVSWQSVVLTDAHFAESPT